MIDPRCENGDSCSLYRAVYGLLRHRCTLPFAVCTPEACSCGVVILLCVTRVVTPPFDSVSSRKVQSGHRSTSRLDRLCRMAERVEGQVSLKYRSLIVLRRFLVCCGQPHLAPWAHVRDEQFRVLLQQPLRIREDRQDTILVGDRFTREYPCAVPSTGRATHPSRCSWPASFKCDTQRSLSAKYTTMTMVSAKLLRQFSSVVEADSSRTWNLVITVPPVLLFVLASYS